MARYPVKTILTFRPPLITLVDSDVDITGLSTESIRGPGFMASIGVALEGYQGQQIEAIRRVLGWAVGNINLTIRHCSIRFRGMHPLIEGSLRQDHNQPFSQYGNLFYRGVRVTFANNLVAFEGDVQPIPFELN
jgi:hypothetical protein